MLAGRCVTMAQQPGTGVAQRSESCGSAGMNDVSLQQLDSAGHDVHQAL